MMIPASEDCVFESLPTRGWRATIPMVFAAIGSVRHGGHMKRTITGKLSVTLWLLLILLCLLPGGDALAVDHPWQLPKDPMMWIAAIVVAAVVVIGGVIAAVMARRAGRRRDE